MVRRVAGLLVGLSLVGSGFAWDYRVAVGGGQSKENNHDYQQRALMLEAQMFPFAKIDQTLIFGLGASLVNWHANYRENKSLTSAALSGVFRAYFAPPKATDKFNPYLTLSFGPTYLFSRKLGEREQGGPLAFQVTMGAGSEFKLGSRHAFDISLKFLHCSNGGIYKPNQGIDVAGVLSIGYLFGGQV